MHRWHNVLPYIAPLVLIVGSLALKALGKDSAIDSVLLGAAAFLFGFTLARSNQAKEE